VGDAALGNPPGFAGDPLLRVRSARLSLRIWPLLSRREIEIGAVRIEGLQANLVGRKDGSNNWTFEDTSPEEAPAAAEAGEDGIASFNLAGITLVDAQLGYTDEADGSRYQVDKLQLATGPVSGGKPFAADATFTLTDLADNSGGDFTVRAQAGAGVEGDVTTLSFTGLEVGLKTRQLGGLAAIAGTLRAPAAEVQLASDTLVRAPGLTAELQLNDPELPGGEVPLKAGITDLRYDVDAGSGTIGSAQAAATVAGVPLDLTAQGTFGARNALTGTVQFPEFSPREVLPALKQDIPKTADPAVLQKMSGSARWFLRDEALGVEQLAVMLDGTKLSGSLSRQLLADGSKATPRTRFDLVIDVLDADRYLEPDEPAGAPPAGGKAAGKPTEIPVATLRGLNLEGRARFGRLTIADLHLAGVDVTATAADGRMRVKPLAAKLYGGALAGGIELDVTGSKPRLLVDQAFTGVDFGALLGDFADVKNIAGTMSLRLDGAAAGATDDELLGNLGGNLAFSLADGLYKGMDVWYEIRRARALIRRKAPPARTGPEETPINTLELAGKLANGVLRTERFTAEIPFLRVSGDATVNLPKGALDSRLTALVFEKPVFADDDSLADLENVRIPLTVSGPVAGPKVRVDLSKMVQGAVKETLRRTVEDKLREKLGIGAPATEPQPADGEPAKPGEDPVKKALDRLFRKN
jgi:AsmA protein